MEAEYFIFLLHMLKLLRKYSKWVVFAFGLFISH